MLGLQHKDVSALPCNGNSGQSSLYLQGLRFYNSLVKGILLKQLTLNSWKQRSFWSFLSCLYTSAFSEVCQGPSYFQYQPKDFLHIMDNIV